MPPWCTAQAKARRFAYPRQPISNDAQASCLDQGSGAAYSGTKSWGSRQTGALDQPEQARQAFAEFSLREPLGYLRWSFVGYLRCSVYLYADRLGDFYFGHFFVSLLLWLRIRFYVIVGISTLVMLWIFTLVIPWISSVLMFGISILVVSLL